MCLPSLGPCSEALYLPAGYKVADGTCGCWGAASPPGGLKLEPPKRSRGNKPGLGRGALPFRAATGTWWLNLHLLEASSPEGHKQAGRAELGCKATCQQHALPSLRRGTSENVEETKCCWGCTSPPLLRSSLPPKPPFPCHTAWNATLTTMHASFHQAQSTPT